MEIRSIVVLSTAHLHPIEAKLLNEFAFSDDFSSLVNTDSEMVEVYKEKGCVMLAELINQIKERHFVTYVLFDVDANLSDNFKVYDW